MKKKHLFVALFLIITLSFTACTQLDVIGNKSITSLDEVLKAMPNNVAVDNTYSGWAIKAPDGSARFIWSKDFNKSKNYDVMIEIDVKPFVDAGLDITKLPSKNISGDKIIVGVSLGDESLSYKEEATPIASYEKIVELKREFIQYHEALNHYGVNLTEGNAFEWAKDITTNDKDIVFVLNPQLFIDAGVNPAKVEGWVFAKIETMDKHGKMIKVDKLLKPFDLK